MIDLNNQVICIVGPTASGKSDLAQSVALETNAQIISADSMQIYKGMDIGTAKVPMNERRVAHYGIDLIEPGEPYSAALFQSYARDKIGELDADGVRSVLVGGTGFYIRAVIDEYDFAEGNQVKNPVRDTYNRLLVQQGPQAVWEALNEVDPSSAHVIHANDAKRVIRALEMHAAGESYAQRLHDLHGIEQYMPAIMIGIHIERDALREKIDIRTRNMIDSGLVDEVKGLLDQGFRDGVTAPQAIGYKEIVSALDGEMSFEEAYEKIATATKRYAKRQMTWFRKDTRINWIEYSDDKTMMLEQALQVIHENEHDRKLDDH